MKDREPRHAAVVVCDSPTLEAAVARGVEVAAGGDLTVLCADRDTAERATTLLNNRGWLGATRVVDPFTPAGLAAAVPVGAGRVLVDPGVATSLSVTALRERLGDGPSVRVAEECERSDVGPTRRRARRLRHSTGTAQRVAVFGVSLVFYLVLGDLTAFDLVTGVVSATVVTLVLSRVTFTDAPTLRRTLPRVGRAALFLPYLLWEVLRANLSLALVLVDPRLPIDPDVETVPIAAESDLERAVLANTISLTPGTVTVDVQPTELRVHTLTADSRAGLRAGSLQRAVRFVFGGVSGVRRLDERGAADTPRTTGGGHDAASARGPPGR